MSKRQRAHGGLAARSTARAATGPSLLDAIGAIVGVGPGRRDSGATAVPDPVRQEAAAARRAARLERNRVNRALGAYTASERPPKPANRGVANPGGERRRARERRDADAAVQAAERAEAAKAERKRLADIARER